MFASRSILVAFAATAFAPFGSAAALRDFSGVVTRVSDGDTFDVLRSDGAIVRVRLRYADAPEVARNSRETTQPLGEDARSYARSLLVGEAVDVRVKGLSYARMVGDVTRTRDGVDAATDLVAHGYAMLDKRYRPPKALQAVEADARSKQLGVWADAASVPPWDWRQRQRDQQILRK